MTHPKLNVSKKLAGEEGFEPSLPDPESGVLPLDDSPVLLITSAIHNITESKSSPLPRLLSDILPSILPQKAARIGQKIQSLLPNPRHCLELLCNRKYKSSAQKCQLLKYQLPKADAAGFLFASPTSGRGYNYITDNGKETIPLAAPPTLPETTPRSADETDMMMAAPSTLPESVTEVASC